jgi:hypothetical protein
MGGGKLPNDDMRRTGAAQHRGSAKWHGRTAATAIDNTLHPGSASNLPDDDGRDPAKTEQDFWGVFGVLVLDSALSRWTSG